MGWPNTPKWPKYKFRSTIKLNNWAKNDKIMDNFPSLFFSLFFFFSSTNFYYYYYYSLIQQNHCKATNVATLSLKGFLVFFLLFNFFLGWSTTFSFWTLSLPSNRNSNTNPAMRSVVVYFLPVAWAPGNVVQDRTAIEKDNSYQYMFIFNK